MKQLLIITFHAVRALLKLLKPGGANSLIAENIALRQQLIVINRSHKRSLNLTTWDRLGFAFLAGLILPKRILKTAIILKPATLLKLHKSLINKKYSNLFSRKSYMKPGPKGPSQEIINLIVEMKQNNPSYGYMRIAMQISNMFGISINKDIVRRMLARNYKPTSDDNGPSWLTFIGHAKDSLWSLDLFRCESISLKTHWVMVVMDQFTRKIIGFAVHCGDLDGITVCSMFNKIQSGKTLPKYLSTDNNPLFKFHRWRANLRIMEVEKIKSVPHTPTSHPFIERVIGTSRREFLDRTLFWTTNDLQNKLDDFQCYYNEKRTHMGLDGSIPNQILENKTSNIIDIKKYRLEKHCRGLFNLSIAA